MKMKFTIMMKYSQILTTTTYLQWMVSTVVPVVVVVVVLTRTFYVGL